MAQHIVGRAQTQGRPQTGEQGSSHHLVQDLLGQVTQPLRQSLERSVLDNIIHQFSAPELDEIVVTDTIPLSDDARACKRIRALSCAQLLAETMTRISNEESVSSLFTE